MMKKDEAVPTLEDLSVNIRRKLKDAAGELEFIANYGLKHMTDVSAAASSKIANFKGMRTNLERSFESYNSLWADMGQLYDSHKKSDLFPKDDDTKQKSAARNHYYTACSILELIVAEEEKRKSERLESSTNTSSVLESRITRSLPKLNLPTFDGQLMNWPKFRDTFLSLVHTERLSVIEKFQYLRASLKGPALGVIATYKVEEGNYALAWSALLDTYDNKRLLASAYLDQLLNFKPLAGKATSETLNHFLNSAGECVAAFDTLDIPNQAEFILFYLSARCLDPNTRELFEMRQKKGTFPKFQDLVAFVREHSIALQLASNINPLACDGTTRYPVTSRTGSGPSQPSSLKFSRPPRAKTPYKTSLIVNKPSSASTINASTSKYHSLDKGSCIACKGEPHHLLSCLKFNEILGPARRALLQKWDGCKNCLSHKHQVQDCPSKWHCRFCSERHHASLHPPSSSGSSSDSTNGPSVSHSPTSLTAASVKGNQIILGTAIAQIMDVNGQLQNIRMVIDSGSQNSFITHRCLNQLGLKMTKMANTISGIGQTLFEGAKGRATCVIQPRDNSTTQLTTEAIVVSTITSLLPSTFLPHSVIQKCRGITLADPTFWKPGKIDFLLGADLFTEIWKGVIKEIDEEGPKLLSSIFGFIVMGKIGEANQASSTSLLTLNGSDNVTLQLEKFWRLEEPIPPSRIQDPEENQCEEHFVQTHYRLENGRYGVRLPFRNEEKSVGDSSSIALRQFYSLERRLKNNPSLQKLYHTFLNEYLDLKHMSPATSPAKFVIPHHGVVKDGPDGPKLRVVFNASVQVPGGSLNDHLLTGCKLQNDVREVIFRFRFHAVAFSSDMVKMFRMIELSPKDRPYQQIYWRAHPDQPVERYELNTVTYGFVCAPYQAQRVLKQLTVDHGNQFPLAAQSLLRDSYVDDVLTGASSVPAAKLLKEELIQLMRKGGFELSKWASNSTELLDNPISSTIKATPVDLSAPEDHWVKILGLQWDPQSDSFFFTIGEPSSNHTKRGILSTVARLYDPLGFLTPTTLLMKSFIQELWTQNLDWDQPLTQELSNAWKNLIAELPLLSELRIDRFIKTTSEATSCQLIGFSDASTKGYAAMFYLRVNGPTGPSVSLLMAKSKLAPIKTQSIPRLELAGALLLANLYSNIFPLIEGLNLSMEPPVMFTDSTIVLAWINTPAHRLKTFAANRVVKIQESTPTASWKHVISEENPCDAASRGIFPSQLLTHRLWWTGPWWINQPLSNWPSSKVELPTDLPEMKEPETRVLASMNPPDCFIQWMSRFSSYMTLIKAAGWLARWIYNLKHMQCCCCLWRFGRLHKIEVDKGLSMCVKNVQTYYFHDHQRTFIKYADLKPYIDGEGIWRVGGRLRHSSIPESAKHPILLPREAHLSELLVDHYHRIYLHPGPTTLQAVIQKQFWIPSLRRLIRLRGFRCKPCYRSTATSITPIMGDLPRYRVNGGRPFQHVGIDFAGPFPLKESSRRNAALGKAYLCLCVCMATKAVHLELVTRLTTEAFLAAFHRFTSRRGLPTDVYSDNGSNFLGAARYLKELYQWLSSPTTKGDLQEYAVDTKINWHFNPPHTPHMGGIWEAGVKSVKRHLRLIGSEVTLTYEELSTWLARIEAILNSRPLCPLSSDPAENNYLSPGHFLVGGPLVIAPEPSLLDTKENLLNRWQLVTRMSEQFWERWSSEYLASLQKRPKWIQMKKNLEIDDLVLLKESSPPLQWKLARVQTIHPGRDGVVRVVTVCRGGSSFTRHVANLVPLPHLSTPSFTQPQ